MGLKELKSNLDLVQGEGPVGGMSDLTVPNFQLATDAASRKHVDSLQTVPGGDSNSPYQDMDGQQGPQFDLGPTSTLQQDSLLTQVPGGDSNSPFQDLDGVQGPQFQKEKSIASQVHESSLSLVPGGDSNSPFQDLDGAPGPQFQRETTAASQAHIDSLQRDVRTEQDLNGEPGPLFQQSTTNASQAHISSLSAVPAQEGGFADRLDGATPTKYLDKLPS